MAVTKTHPIKSTLKAAIDYILNPEKTDGKLLASSFGCGLETADIEFAWTREAAGDRGTHLGRHLIQSFAVGETTPEEAHKIGMELAGAVLGGKYEFVLTTHVDKDHLHNHLIFNAVSFVDYKKYHSNKQSYHFIRRTSDRICKEHGLSVVVPGQDKGKSYAEYTAEKQGTSYKAKLKTAIDTLIPQVKDFDELLRRLQEMGYEIKQGKYISFRAAGQERFTRTKTLGAAYTEEAIKERIKGVYTPDFALLEASSLVWQFIFRDIIQKFTEHMIQGHKIDELRRIFRIGRADVFQNHVRDILHLFTIIPQSIKKLHILLGERSFHAVDHVVAVIATLTADVHRRKPIDWHIGRLCCFRIHSHKASHVFAGCV